MANHIFGYEKKVTTDSTGTLYDSGGAGGVYNAHEFDYFIIRKDSATNDHIMFDIESWVVADYGTAVSDYDYIDVYQIADGDYDPSNWQWVERIGGADINASGGGLLEPADMPVEYYLEADWVKLVFRSNFRQNYTFTGFKISWFSDSAAASGYADLAAAAATTYADEQNLKENAMDSKSTVDDGILRDPAKTNWDFIPAGQFDDTGDIGILNHRFTDMDYAKGSGVDASVPLSYTSPERQHHAQNVGNITIEGS